MSRLYKRNPKLRSKRTSGRRSQGGLHDQSISTRVPIRFLYTTTFSSSASTTVVTEFNLTCANMGDRAIDFADIFLYWRATAAHMRQVVECGASSATVVSPPGSYLHAVSWVPISDADTTTPTTFNMLEFPGFELNNGTMPCVLRQRGKDMKTLSPWLTTSSTPDAILQACGTLTVTTISGPLADATSAALTRGYCEMMLVLRTPAASQVTPLRGPFPVFHALPTRITEIYRDGTSRCLLDKRRESCQEFLARKYDEIPRPISDYCDTYVKVNSSEEKKDVTSLSAYREEKNSVLPVRKDGLSSRSSMRP